ALLDQIHAIITDAGIDDATREGLQRLGIEVIIAEPTA
ncbi:MAG: DeoR family transcriptional regulator, partial [Stenotrophomonas maltophilia]